MTRSDEIAVLIPYYRQFIAEQRAYAQKQADKLRQKQATSSAAVSPAGSEAGGESPAETAGQTPAAEEVPIEETEQGG